jgi:hypothetical protein
VCVEVQPDDGLLVSITGDATTAFRTDLPI